jgi:hypothetical protein
VEASAAVESDLTERSLSSIISVVSVKGWASVGDVHRALSKPQRNVSPEAIRRGVDRGYLLEGTTTGDNGQEMNIVIRKFPK